MLLCVAGTALTVRAQKVTLNFRNAKLEQVFGRITEQTGYTFYYARPTVNPDKVVSIAVADVDVRAALKQLLADDKVEIEIRDGKIYLSPPRQSAAVPQSVKGVVRDAAGQPVVGAAVIVKGTTRGVSSGTDGSFSFEGLADGAVLQVSALGYASAEIPVGNRSFVTVELKEDATLVDEVVVVGYGTQKKANLTGAVDQVSSELLENRPVANVTQMLQGAVPNLNISLADGKPNRSASYNIRGKTSIGAGGSALVLIDGVEGDPAMLNPNDIESVSVLKDAASAAIYGSRAPYGVVLITTKDPGKLTDKFTINYTGNVSIQQPTAIPDVVDDGYVYSRLFYDAWYNYRFNEPTGFNNSQDFSRAWLDTFRQRKLAGNKLETTVEPDGKYVYYGNTDYYDALYKDTVIAQTHNISVSGSNGKISHYLSGRLYDYNGLFNFTPDTYRTMNLRSKVSSQVFKWLKISNNFDYTHDHYRQPMGYSKEGGGVLWRSLNDQGHPSSPIFNPDGTLTKSGAYAIGGLVTGNNWLDRTTKTLKNTTTLNVTMLENRLRLTGDFSFRTKDYTETKKTTAIPYSAYEGEIVYLGTPETDDVMKESLQLTTYIATNAYAEFEDTFAEKHYFKALAEKEAYTPEECRRDVYEFVWASTLKGRTPDALEMMLQREYVRSLSLSAGLKYTGTGAREEKKLVSDEGLMPVPAFLGEHAARTAALTACGERCGHDPFETFSAAHRVDTAPLLGYGSPRLNYYDPRNTEAGDYAALLKLRAMLRTKSVSATGEARLHYELLLRNIEKALKK